MIQHMHKCSWIGKTPTPPNTHTPFPHTVQLNLCTVLYQYFKADELLTECCRWRQLRYVIISQTTCPFGTWLRHMSRDFGSYMGFPRSYVASLGIIHPCSLSRRVYNMSASILYVSWVWWRGEILCLGWGESNPYVLPSRPVCTS